MKRAATICTALGVFLLVACEPEPQSIQFGNDQCDYCRMMITDQEFGSQVLNNQGRAYKFDSIECLVAYDLTTDKDNVHSKWVPDFQNSGEWLNTEDAVFLHSETLRSPMGLYLSAYSDRESAENMAKEYGGEIVGYEKVKEIVSLEWLSNHTDLHHQN